MFLLDTNFISELRRKDPDPRALAWAQSLDQSEAYLSALTIGELVKGAQWVKERKPAEHVLLLAWIQSIECTYGERILPVNAPVAKRYGVLARSRSFEQHCGVVDILIAATAIEHGLTVVTRNVQHFVQLNVAHVNPWMPIGSSSGGPAIEIGPQ